MKKNIITFIVFSFLFFSSTFAQKDFKKGFIINNNNDTIFGLINYRTDKQNSEKCEFKKDEGAEIQLFSPFDIKAYRIEGSKFYISKEIPVNNIKKTVFLEYLVDGILDLFYLTDFNNEYYYIQNDSGIYQLSNEEREIIKEYYDTKTVYKVNSNQYKGTLNYLLNDAELRSKINNTNFDYKSLINLTKTYHEKVCSEYSCIDYTKSTNTRIYLEPYVSFVYSVMNLQTSKDKTFDLKPAIGIDFIFMSIRSSRSWNFITGLNYSQHNFEEIFNNTIYDEYGVDYLIKAEYPVIRIPMKFEYFLTSKKITPSFSLGYNNVFIIKPQYSIKEERYISDILAYEVIKGSEFKKYYYGFSGGVGLRYKLNESFLTLKGNYEFRIPYGNSNHILDYQRFHTFSLSLGYCFKL